MARKVICLLSKQEAKATISIFVSIIQSTSKVIWRRLDLLVASQKEKYCHCWVKILFHCILNKITQLKSFNKKVMMDH